MVEERIALRLVESARFRVVGLGVNPHFFRVPHHDLIAAIAAWLDRWIIAGVAVRGTHGTSEWVGRALRLLQTGNLQTYAFLFAMGVALMLYLALK